MCCSDCCCQCVYAPKRCLRSHVPVFISETPKAKRQPSPLPGCVVYERFDVCDFDSFLASHFTSAPHETLAECVRWFAVDSCNFKYTSIRPSANSKHIYKRFEVTYNSSQQLLQYKPTVKTSIGMISSLGIIASMC